MLFVVAECKVGNFGADGSHRAVVILDGEVGHGARVVARDHLSPEQHAVAMPRHRLKVSCRGLDPSR